MDAWSRELGTQQGRIAPAGWAAPEGTHVFCLGSDAAGRFARLNTGDHAEVSQVADFASVSMVRAVARLRAPATIPAGTAWVFSLRIDGAVRVSRTLEAGRTRELLELATNTALLAPGDHTLAFRLELVAA